MKAVIGMLVFVGLTAQAQVKPPMGDQPRVDLICHEKTGLPSGVGVTISSGGFVYMTRANVTYRQNLGPVVNIANVIVNQVSDPHRPGAPTYYVGNHFKLEVKADVYRPDQGMPAHLWLVADEHTIDQDLICHFPMMD